MARILVADDDLFYRRLVTGWLEGMGYEVTAVADGDETFRQWQVAEPAFDCLVLDVYMAGISGLELLEKIREIIAIEDNRGRRAPVIIMTSDENAQTELEARQKKAFSFLIKPFTKEQLEKVVTKALFNRV